MTEAMSWDDWGPYDLNQRGYSPHSCQFALPNTGPIGHAHFNHDKIIICIDIAAEYD